MVELSWSILTTILDNRSIIPWIYNISGTRCKVLVAAAWGLSALFASPMLFISGVPAGRNECWIELPSAFHWQVCILFKEVFFDQGSYHYDGFISRFRGFGWVILFALCLEIP